MLKCGWGETDIVWTEFLPRRHWKGVFKHSAMDKARRKLNRAMRVFCEAMDIKVLSHVNIQEEQEILYRSDGVHLSKFGYAYYMMEIRELLSTLWQEYVWCSRF